MGAARKTETIIPQKKALPKWNMNTNPWSARKLAKKDLGSVIFGCKHSTYKECIDKQLFGLPAGHFQYVQNVTQGMPLFLFNYSDRKLYGIFEAISAGQWEINPYAWTSNDQGKTSYPAQVRVKNRMHCRPLTEDKYQPILAKNYSPHKPNHFQFELDKSQTQQLIALFSNFPLRQNVSTPHLAVKWGISTHNDNEKENVNAIASFQGKSWSSLFKPQSDSIQKNQQVDSKKPGLHEEIRGFASGGKMLLGDGVKSIRCNIPNHIVKLHSHRRPHLG